MFKSIFGKLLTVNLLIIVVVILITGIIMFAFVGNYATSKQESNFYEYAEAINGFSEEIVRGSYNDRIINMYLASMCKNYDSLIFITNSNGKIMYSSNYRVTKHIKTLKKEQYQDMINGKTIKKIGNYDGLYNQPMFTIGFPLKYGEQNVGAIIMSTPMPDIYKIRSDIIIFFIFSGLISSIIAFLLAYFTSKSISRSIYKLDEAATALSKGDYTKRVSINSKDEIDHLAHTFNTMAESIEQSEITRRTFIANASHELRTPITTITGFLEGIVDKTIPDSDRNRYLEIVLYESKKLNRLVNELLDVVRMENDGNDITITAFDINELIRITLISFENRINDKKMNINVSFFEENVIVEADKDKIQRVLTNLIDNAIKYSNEGGYISVFVTSKNSKKVLVEVKNTGPGISEDDISHIWDRFYKSDKSRTNSSQGVGLGLYITKNIITQHNQEINVYSKHNEYTSFVFSLNKSKY